MRGYGHDPGPVIEGVQSDRNNRTGTLEERIQNAPKAVLGQIGLILVIALGFAFVVNLLLFAFRID